MKKLTNLILGLTLTAVPLFSQADSLKYSQQDLLFYKKVKESIEKADTLSTKPFDLSNIGLVNMYSYDFNKDNRVDASEIYTLKYSALTGRLEQAENPFCYIFDYNNDGMIEYKEFLIDEEQDGLNGNERFSDFLQVKKQKVREVEI